MKQIMLGILKHKMFASLHFLSYMYYYFISKHPTEQVN